MKLEYSITENDYLEYYLYLASKSKRIRKQRINSRVFFLIVYLICLSFLIHYNNLALLAPFLLFGIPLIFKYPRLQRESYVSNYKKWLKENFEGRFNRISIVNLENDHIFIVESGIESKIHNIEIEEVVEIPNYIYVKIKTGQDIILPKERIPDKTELRDKLENLATNLGIPYNHEENWKWN